jgi:hypothetical protein
LALEGEIQDRRMHGTSDKITEYTLFPFGEWGSQWLLDAGDVAQLGFLGSSPRSSEMEGVINKNGGRHGRAAQRATASVAKACVSCRSQEKESPDMV